MRVRPAPRPDRGRMLLADAALAAVLAAVILVATADAAAAQGMPVPDLTGYLLLLVSAAVVAVRRLAPVTTFAVTVVAATVYFAVGYPVGPGVYPVLVATYTVATRLPLARSAILCGSAMVASAGTLLLASAWAPSAGVSRSALVVVSWAGWLVLPWAIGAVARLQREQRVREEVAQARARDEDLRRHATEERLRVARDLHDSVGHNLAVIAMQAGVALHILDERPHSARQALEAIRAQSKDGLDSLRSALDVFRDPGEAAAAVDAEPVDRAPAPGLDQLGALVEQTRAAGLQVSLRTSGEPVTVPAVVDQAAYRIVQEALTNTLRHAATDRVQVEICYQAGELAIDVFDVEGSRVLAAAHPGEHAPVLPGHGITGMRERARAVGGTCSADRTPDGFRVSARLPLAHHQGNRPA